MKAPTPTIPPLVIPIAIHVVTSWSALSEVIEASHPTVATETETAKPKKTKARSAFLIHKIGPASRRSFDVGPWPMRPPHRAPHIDMAAKYPPPYAELPREAIKASKPISIPAKRP